MSKQHRNIAANLIELAAGVDAGAASPVALILDIPGSLSLASDLAKARASGFLLTGALVRSLGLAGNLDPNRLDRGSSTALRLAKLLARALADDLARSFDPVIDRDRPVARARLLATDLSRGLDRQMAASQARSQAERLYESLASPPLQADLPLEIVDLYVLVAAITGALLVIAGAPDPAIEAPLAQQVVPTVLVETLAGDQLRLRHAVSAAEELATALTQLAAALHASGDRAMAAVVGRQAEAISSLAKSDAPPPRSINAAMLDGQEMLRSHTTRAEIEAALLADGFSADDATRRAAQIETLEAAFELPHDDDGVGYSNALAELARFGESLQTDDDAAAPDGTSRLRELTRDGLEDGYKKLLAALVVGSPIALLAGLRWLTQYHFNLATMYKFAIGIVKARTGL